MQTLTAEITIDEKIQDLCETILADEEYCKNVACIEALLDDPSSKEVYVKFAQKGEEMHQKQHSGAEVTDADLDEYETLRKAADENSKVKNFMSAQNELNSLHQKVSKYISKTIENGKVPTEKEMNAKDGCCGGGCGCD
ncbi:MAG: YlbF family regulator [Verrucomicrobiales bacterium]|nr:YlbF family regulator [Verrucomicrobiales bacterium]